MRDSECIVWFIHHISDNLILNQRCSKKYNDNENIHVDNNGIRTLEVLLVNGITIEDYEDWVKKCMEVIVEGSPSQGNLVKLQLIFSRFF